MSGGFSYSPPRVVKRAAVRIVEPRAGRRETADVAEFTCDRVLLAIGGVVLMTNAVSDKGNPNEPSPALYYWPTPGTFISVDQIPEGV